MDEYYSSWPQMHISISEVTDEQTDDEVSSIADGENSEKAQSSSGESSGSSTPIITFPSEENLVEFHSPQEHSFSFTFHATNNNIHTACSTWPSSSHEVETFPTSLSVANVSPRAFRRPCKDNLRQMSSLSKTIGGFRVRGLVKYPMMRIARSKAMYSLYNEARILPTSITVSHTPSQSSNNRSPRWMSAARKAVVRSRRGRKPNGVTYDICLSSISEEKEPEDGNATMQELNNMETRFSCLFSSMRATKEPLAIEEVKRKITIIEEDELCERLTELPVVDYDPDSLRSLRHCLQSFHVSTNAQE